jgi:hypothetical protein
LPGHGGVHQAGRAEVPWPVSVGRNPVQVVKSFNRQGRRKVTGNQESTVFFRRQNAAPALY